MKAWHWVVLVLIVGVGVYMYNKMKLPLGIRNNNPGNLRDNNIDWRGRVGSNKGFVVFDSIQNGVRAMALDITNDYYRKGLKTIRQLINEFAPSVENNTESYVQHVAGKVGINPDAPMTQIEPYLADLVSAMIYHENGRSIADYDLLRGITAAMDYRKGQGFA